MAFLRRLKSELMEARSLHSSTPRMAFGAITSTGVSPAFPHALDLLLGKPQPLAPFRMDAALQLYVVDPVDIAFVVRLHLDA